MTEEQLQEAILPILSKTYGAGSYTEALAAALADRISHECWDSRGREYMVMLACWDWFSGGTTAEATARKIEEAIRPDC